jgi:hypothetical protein
MLDIDLVPNETAGSDDDGLDTPLMFEINSAE